MKNIIRKNKRKEVPRYFLYITCYNPMGVRYRWINTKKGIDYTMDI